MVSFMITLIGSGSVTSGFQRPENLVVLGEAALGLLGEHQFAIDGDLENAAAGAHEFDV